MTDSAIPPHDGDLGGRWETLVTVALLGTDRRDPPAGTTVIDELVDDTQRARPAARLLAQAAAVTAARRAGARPGAPGAPFVPPPPDHRPACPSAATDRWRHVVAVWPVLEDEWLAAVIAGGWRIDPVLVPALLLRHQRDMARLALVDVAAGPLARWLVDVDDELGDALGARLERITPGSTPLALPSLPIPDALERWREHELATVTGNLLAGLRSGQLAASHRTVLVNLVARLTPDVDGLRHLVDALSRLDPLDPAVSLATALADLAATRASMLDELGPTTAVTPAR
ncbi:MAG: hypothetical protein AAGF73_14285 [Actinomycetota bacterium]